MTNTRQKACAAIVAALIIGEATDGVLIGQSRIDWGNVATLQAGRRIVVHLLPDNRRVQGEYVTSDETSLTLNSGGVARNIKRDEILRLVARRDSPRRKYVAIGAVVGAGAGVASVAGQEDWSALGRAMWAAIGAGVGALVGLIASRGADTELIYEIRPLPPRAPVPSTSATRTTPPPCIDNVCYGRWNENTGRVRVRIEMVDEKRFLARREVGERQRLVGRRERRWDPSTYFLTWCLTPMSAEPAGLASQTPTGWPSRNSM